MVKDKKLCKKSAVALVSADMQFLLISFWQLSLESKTAHISCEPVGGKCKPDISELF